MNEERFLNEVKLTLKNEVDEKRLKTIAEDILVYTKEYANYEFKKRIVDDLLLLFEFFKRLEGKDMK